MRTRVLEKAGLCLDDSARQTLSEQAKQLDEVKARHDKGEFDTLEQCTEVCSLGRYGEAKRSGMLCTSTLSCLYMSQQLL